MLETADAMPCSHKPQGGLGLVNVRAIAQKYNGTFSFSASEGVFRNSVLFSFPHESGAEADE